MRVFFNDTATTEIYTLSRHDALPISADREVLLMRSYEGLSYQEIGCLLDIDVAAARKRHGRALLRLHARSEEHTSELQSRQYLVCRLLLEKKKPRSRADIGSTALVPR